MSPFGAGVVIAALVLALGLSILHDNFEGPERVEHFRVTVPHEQARLGEPGWAGWITVPPGFRAQPRTWGGPGHYEGQDLPIFGGRYEAAVWVLQPGDAPDSRPVHVLIGIRRPEGSSRYVIGDLRVPRTYVDLEKVEGPIERVVEVDEAKRVVTFRLGKSMFRFQMPPADVEAVHLDAFDEDGNKHPPRSVERDGK